MSTARQLPLTAAQYLDIERASDTRHEFYRGEMTAMSGVTRRHSLIVGNLSRHIGNQLDGGPCEVHAVDLRVHAGQANFFTYPDIFIVCGEPLLLDSHFDTILNPTAIIEVLSDSTESYDRGEKFSRYRQLDSLRTYVLVSQHQMAVEWFDRNDRDHHASWTFRAAGQPDESLRIDSLAVPVSIPLALIYDRVPVASPLPRSDPPRASR